MQRNGEVAERLKAAVLKTARGQLLVSSNLTLSANAHHGTFTASPSANPPSTKAAPRRIRAAVI